MWHWHHTFKFCGKVFFYVMGKALLGELSCTRTGLVINKGYRSIIVRGCHSCYLQFQMHYLILVIFSSPGRSPGRAIVLPLAEALALAKC